MSTATATGRGRCGAWRRWRTRLLRPGRGDGAGVDANGADRDLLGQDVQFGEVLAGAYRALATADELEAGRAEGGRGDLGGAADDRADLDPGQRPTPVGAVGDDRDHGVGGADQRHGDAGEPSGSRPNG